MANTKPKQTWGPGPWQNEPDEKRWTDEATGLPCVLLRGPHGAWCGYVGVPEDHPAYDLPYSRSDFPLEDVLSGKAMVEVHVQHQVNEIAVHGGLTFAREDQHRGAGYWWFGFDCSHAGDYSPKYDRLDDPHIGLGRPTGWGTFIEYRDIEYAMRETTSLAKQLAAITASAPTTSAPHSQTPLPEPR